MEAFESRGIQARTYLRVVIAVTVVALANCNAGNSNAADYRTRNFIIQAPTSELAKAVGDAAEHYRNELSSYWLGSSLRPWPVPCPVRVVAGPNLAAQGVTTYNRAPVRDFQMEVVGTPERILDSVLPHEITHTILATHFGRPLPRWADEGICTTVEHESEKQKHEAKLREFLRTRRGIAMNRLFLLTEYPNDVLPMYAQGYSVCRFLIEQDSPKKFIEFLHDYMQHPSWTQNIRKHYRYESLAELQQSWLSWVADGSGPVAQFAKADPAVKPAVATIATAEDQNQRLLNRDGKLRTSVGSRDRSRTRDLANVSAATSLASATDKGWYLRRKLEAAGETTSERSMASATEELPKLDPANQFPPSKSLANSPAPKSKFAADSIMPPSVRDRAGFYSAAQPQPEQSFSRGGHVFRRVAPQTLGSAREQPQFRAIDRNEMMPTQKPSDTGLRGDFPANRPSMLR